MRPGTPIRSSADAQRLWQDLMGTDGFGERSLWVLFLEDDGRTSELLMPIDDLPARPDERFVGNLAKIIADVGVPGVLLLLSRPGSRAMTEDDRAWARSLTRALRGRCPWPMHLATRDAVREFAADDLLAAS